MRLPLRHPPPDRDPPLHGCAHLAALAHAAVGLPLGAAAELVAPDRSRGRHGNALQWHLGLPPHDGQARLDWEDRIEIKLVSVWQRAGAVVCDKLKVSDVAVDPWRKLSNVLWVFADRLTRVVVGTRAWSLRGAARERLSSAWSLDPHFDQPALVVEARERADGSAAPSYYLAARWLAERACELGQALDCEGLGELRALGRGGGQGRSVTITIFFAASAFWMRPIAISLPGICLDEKTTRSPSVSLIGWLSNAMRASAARASP